MGEKLFSVMGAIIGLAIVAVIVQSANTSKVLVAGGSAFTNSVRAAMGNV